MACAVSIFQLNYVAALFAGPKFLLKNHVKIYRNITPVCFTGFFFIFLICMKTLPFLCFQGME